MERAESFGVGLDEIQVTFTGALDGPGWGWLVWIMQRVRDEEAHVVLGDVHFCGAGFGVDHAVGDALWMDHDFDLGEWDREEVVGFVDF